MSYEDGRSARDAEAEARAQADSQLAASLTFMNDRIASAEFEPRRVVRPLLWLAAAFASISIMLLATYSSALGYRVTDLESRLTALEAA